MSERERRRLSEWADVVAGLLPDVCPGCLSRIEGVRYRYERAVEPLRCAPGEAVGRRMTAECARCGRVLAAQDVGG